MVVLAWSESGRQGDGEPNGLRLATSKSAVYQNNYRLMTTARDQLSKADTITNAAIEAGIPALTEARNLIVRFRTMIRRKATTEFGPWIADTGQPVRPCQRDPERQGSGVCSNHRTLVKRSVERQLNKLKLVRRQMYGRAKLDLLQARLIGAM